MNETKKNIVAKTIWSATNILRGTHSMSHTIECILELLFWRFVTIENNLVEMEFEPIPEGCDLNDIDKYNGNLSLSEYCDQKYSELLNGIHHCCDIRPLSSFSEGQKLHQDNTSLRELIKLLHNTAVEYTNELDFIRDMFDMLLQFGSSSLGGESGDW